ncbi:MAG: hypothetical protein WC216_06210 [Gallionella sp.]|jgi:hypothetical protein
MKFKSELKHRKWVWRQSFYNASRTDYSSLTESEKAWLQALNESLRQIESKYSVIMNAKCNELEARVTDSSDWLMDFNLICVITLYLREDDPDYKEDDDNILMEMWEIPNSRDREQDWGFGATKVHHAEPSAHFPGEHHCYLYHQLYDHCYLDWSDLFRIGSIWVDIKIDEQSGVLPVPSVR